MAEMVPSDGRGEMGMSDFGEGIWVIGRKPHRCDGCGAIIPKGESQYNYRGKYGGEWQNWRMHKECFDAWDADDSGEFMTGDMEVPERIVSAL